jgi:hypothetical protein
MPFPLQTGYASTTGIDWTHAERGRVSMFAASDILAGMPVTLIGASFTASSSIQQSGFSVRMCASQNDQPFGIARDAAAAGQPVTVYDAPNYLRLVVNGSVNLGQQVGVTAFGSTAVCPPSGVTVQFPVLGQVTAASTSNYVAYYGNPSATTFNAVWAIGQALEPANPGQGAVVQIAPRLLSGLA